MRLGRSGSPAGRCNCGTLTSTAARTVVIIPDPSLWGFSWLSVHYGCNRLKVLEQSLPEHITSQNALVSLWDWLETLLVVLTHPCPNLLHKITVHMAVSPPSMVRDVPVMKLDSSLARKAAAAATSDTFPIR